MLQSQRYLSYRDIEPIDEAEVNWMKIANKSAFKSPECEMWFATSYRV